MVAVKFVADFVPNFVAMATGVGRSKICLAEGQILPFPIDFDFAPCIATSRVTQHAIMATGVGRGRICLASFNSPTPKTPC